MNVRFANFDTEEVNTEHSDSPVMVPGTASLPSDIHVVVRQLHRGDIGMKKSLVILLALACMVIATITLFPSSAQAGCGCGTMCVNDGNPNDECDHDHLGAGCETHEGWTCPSV